MGGRAWEARNPLATQRQLDRSTHPDFYHSTIHAPWYVFEHWSEFFEIEGYLPDGAWSQDLVVLKRREAGSPTSRPPLARQALSQRGPAPNGSASARTIRATLRQFVHRNGAAIDAYDGEGTANLDDLTREMKMIRAGLYEQGRRISILAAQLREEIRDSTSRRE